MKVRFVWNQQQESVPGTAELSKLSAPSHLIHTPDLGQFVAVSLTTSLPFAHFWVSPCSHVPALPSPLSWGFTFNLTRS